jgi:undecaprenyl diphosphate synthase
MNAATDSLAQEGRGCASTGFLPMQSVYADFFVVVAYWPDFEPHHFASALEWFGRQDRTRGG